VAHDEDVAASGLSTERLYFGEQNTLDTAAPSAISASDSYAVDFTASSGKPNDLAHRVAVGRCGIFQIAPGEDKKLLVYDSAPLDADLEITGTALPTPRNVLQPR